MKFRVFLSPSYLNLLNMHTFTLKYNYLNLFKLPHIYVHFYIFYSVSCDTWDLKIFLYPCKHFGKSVFAIGVQSVIFLSRLQGLHSWRSLKILSLISFTPTYVCKNSYKWSIVGPTFYFAMVIYVIHPNTIFPSFICEWIQKNTHWWPGWRALFKNRDIIQKI